MKLKQLLVWLWLIHSILCLIYSLAIKDDAAKSRFYTVMSMLALIVAKLNNMNSAR